MLTRRQPISPVIDRVEAMGGTISLSSPTGQGTSLLVDLPIKGG
jgi:chemotaxis protein histidine kinase CheA